MNTHSQGLIACKGNEQNNSSDIAEAVLSMLCLELVQGIIFTLVIEGGIIIAA